MINPKNNFSKEKMLWYYGLTFFGLIILISLASIFLPGLLKIKTPSINILENVQQVIQEKIPEEKITEIKQVCYYSQKGTYEAQLSQKPDTAINSLDFSRLKMRGLIQWLRDNLGLSAEDISGKGTKDEIQEKIKNYYQSLTQIKVDTLSCYVDNLDSYPKTKKRYQEQLNQAKEELLRYQNEEFNDLLAIKQSVQPIVELGPKENKNFRIRTFCLDSSAYPPSSGQLYALAGEVDEFKKPYCSLLRQAGQEKDPTDIQNEIWELDFQKPEAISKNEPLQEAQSLFSANKQKKILFQAQATGTITDFDVKLTNLTNNNLVLDTSCVYLIPIKVPTTMMTKKYQSQVLGYTTSYATQEQICNAKPEEMDLIHPAQVGIGPQTVGTSGIIGSSAPVVSKLPELVSIPVKDNRDYTQKNLDQAWEIFLDEPYAANLEELLEAIKACRVLGCTNTNEIERLMHENIEQVMDEYLDKYQGDPSQENMIDAVEAMNLCTVMGCEIDKAMIGLSEAAKNHLKKLQQEQCQGNSQ